MGLVASLFIDLFNDFSQFSYSINTVSASILGFIVFVFLNSIGEKVFNIIKFKDFTKIKKVA